MLVNGFHVFNEAWYAEANPLRDGATAEIMFGEYCTRGGSAGEAAVRWYDLNADRFSGHARTYFRFEFFGDAAHLFSRPEYAAILAWAADNQRATPEDFAAWLVSVGFADLTARERK